MLSTTLSTLSSNLKNATNLFTPDHRLPHTFSTHLTHLTPLYTGSYVMGLLVQRRNTRSLRIALLPLVLCLFFRASHIDLAKGNDISLLGYLNTFFLMGLFMGALRSIIWAFESEPYIKAPEAFSIRCNGILAQQLVNAIDLQFNSRGYGWNWGETSYPDNETRSLSNRSAFIKKTAFALVLDIIGFEQIYHLLELVSPLATVMSAHAGASIFDGSSPPQHLLRSLLTGSLFCCLMAASSQLLYDIGTIICVAFLQQPLFLWPPIFSSPWYATSVTEFWGCRWHQVLRNLLLRVSRYPLYPVFGKGGVVLGAFFITGAIHDFGLRGRGNGSSFWKVVGFFVMNGVGILLEISWKRVTGHRVSGWKGWIWCIIWMHLWGLLITDAWVEHGFAAELFPPGLPRLSMSTPPLSIFQPLSVISPNLPDQVYLMIGIAKVLIYVRLHPLIH